MKSLAILAAAATALVASTAVAQTPPPPADAPPLCLHSQDIDHTKAPDDRTILIYMRRKNLAEQAALAVPANLVQRLLFRGDAAGRHLPERPDHPRDPLRFGLLDGAARTLHAAAQNQHVRSIF